ncbi:MAG: iron ABC transporter permease [Thermoplasmata archaeon]|nr:iron ABC transporter permease [Thermoplasmata archaeon]
MDPTIGRTLYRNITRKRVLFILIAAITVAIAFMSNMLINLSAGPIEGLKALFDPDSVSKSTYLIMHYYRLPESCFGLLVGLALGMAGAEMQTVLNNPLAEPYTLGISSAASFGAALSIAFGFGATVFGNYSTIILAFAFSMMICLVITSVINRRTANPTTTILLGVAMLFLFQSLVSLIQSISNKDAANSIMFWMFGSIGRDNNYSDIGILALVVVLVATLFAWNAWKLTSLKMGDSKVNSMGIDVTKLRRNIIIGISLVTATAVSFTGTIGFVGLVGPHIARMLVGDDQRFLLPMSGLCGAAMVLIASIICKFLENVASLPIGVVTSLVGVPFFIYLIMRKRAVVS